MAAMTSASAGGILDLQGHAEFDLAVPTPDHFIPLLYLAGLAEAAGQPAEVLVHGYVHRTASMTSYTLGYDGRSAAAQP